MELTITKKPIDNCQLALTIEVDPKRVDQELRKAARKAGRQYRIPGFRKGKAPFHVIAQYVGLPTLYNEFMEDLGQEVFKQAMEQEEITPYAQASLDKIDIEPLTYTLTVPMEPKVDLGDYRSVRVDKEEVEVSVEAIEAQLEALRDQHAGWVSVDRPSEYGDLMTIDVHSVLIEEDKEGAESEETEKTIVLDETDWDVTPDKENPMEPPGFDEALIGLVATDEKEFTLSWNEDSPSIYAGQSAVFTVTVHDVQAYEKAELNDELAQLVGPDFETLDDLRENIRENLVEQAEQEAEAAYFGKVMIAITEQCTISYPPVVVEDQIDAMLGQIEQQVRQAGYENLKTYFEGTGEDYDEFRETQREPAIQLAEQNLIVSEVIRQENLQAADEDIERQIQTMIGASFGEGATGEDLDKEQAQQIESLATMFREGSGRQMIESQILQEKAIERIVAIGRGEEIPKPTEPGTVESTSDRDTTDDANDAEAESNDAERNDRNGASAEDSADLEAPIEDKAID